MRAWDRVILFRHTLGEICVFCMPFIIDKCIVNGRHLWIWCTFSQLLSGMIACDWFMCFSSHTPENMCFCMSFIIHKRIYWCEAFVNVRHIQPIAVMYDIMWSSNGCFVTHSGKLAFFLCLSLSTNAIVHIYVNKVGSTHSSNFVIFLKYPVLFWVKLFNYG